MDTAAEDAVVGERAMAKLEAELRRHGLQVVSVPAMDAIPCAGIGGQARIQRIVDAPVGVAGIHGLLRFTVLADTDKFQTPLCCPYPSWRLWEPSLTLATSHCVLLIVIRPAWCACLPDMVRSTSWILDMKTGISRRLLPKARIRFALCACSPLSNQNFGEVQMVQMCQLRH